MRINIDVSYLLFILFIYDLLIFILVMIYFFCEVFIGVWEGELVKIIKVKIVIKMW